MIAHWMKPVAGAAISLALTSIPPSFAQGDSKPNILIIMADDIG
jgi:hypothetical protein